MRKTIEADEPWWKLDLQEVWAYRHLVFLFSGRSLATMYKQSILGRAWFVIQPVVTAGMFYLVFGLLMRVPTGGMPYLLFYMSGMVLWYLFTNVFTQTATSLAGNVNLYGKIYFPRLVLPLSYVVSGLVLFGLNLFVLVAFWILYRLRGAPLAVRPGILLMPLAVAQVVATGLGFGLCVAAATVRFRDVKFLLPTLVQFWMFATPIFYSTSQVSPAVRRFVWLNPMAMPVEFFRHGLSGMNPVGLEAMLPAVLVTTVVLVAGLFWFNRAQRDFIDIV